MTIQKTFVSTCLIPWTNPTLILFALPQQAGCETAPQTLGFLDNHKVLFPRRSFLLAHKATSQLLRTRSYTVACYQEPSNPSLDRYTRPKLHGLHRTSVQFLPATYPTYLRRSLPPLSSSRRCSERLSNSLEMYRRLRYPPQRIRRKEPL